MAAENFCLAIKDLTGKVYQIDVLPTTTIGEIKEKLHVEGEIPKEALRLMKGSKPLLVDEQTIGDCGIMEGTKLRLIVRLMNCITESYMQGTWFWAIAKNLFYRIEINGSNLKLWTNASDNGETRYNYDFNVKKDYFGFYLYNDRTRNPTEFIPKSITRGFIKSHRKNAETDIQFFMREQNEDALKRIREDCWPDFSFPGGHSDQLDD